MNLNIHGNEKLDPYGCSYCDETRSSINSINSHLKKHKNASFKYVNNFSFVKKTKPCGKCRKILPWDNFYTKTGRIFNLSHICKKCDSAIRPPEKKTLKRFFQRIRVSSERHSKERYDSGRLEAGTCSITTENLFELWNKQKGLCFYSGIPMNYVPNTNWKISIERLNDNKGYHIDNIVLVCLEFNNSTKWTTEKFIKLLNTTYDNINAKKIIEEATIKTNKNLNTKHMNICDRTKIIDNITTYFCKRCNKFKEAFFFYEMITRGCKKCSIEYTKDFRNLPRGRFKSLLNHAYKNTKTRENIKNRKHDNFCDLTIEDIHDTFIEQSGRCFYSNKKLEFSSGDFLISLERINVRKGYTKSNIALICFEFNAMDHSGRSIEPIDGAGWTKDKYKYFENIAKNYYKLDE